ncbi:hypothetical protein [Flavobacterium aquatile]|uniref:Uncharacterized protein n=1 Tax=Flavobacterium aquatile LMG 4008 = ATCC 11947 TaxID=1453498 RepID=A0A095SYH5_9FLAO|nr:hypothetical protein [Flavobacterium aquatile]KGD69444.1 hypothetical protein LG45_01350 [Flavobacterium aquatile LMG 4008 = ATCC 11947]OXA66100.1 hypothetical protein B0A61_12565 [Flavobacterium aquatile LMG 4008 = ATCC 11947]GEC77585.1 hypothetical protein FAQ01_04550 [Flavobacterium aquatile]
MSEVIEEVNEVETTAFAKGLKLEKEFCEFLKTNLGWTSARIRSQMSAKNNMRGTQVDVIAERSDDRGRRITKVAWFYIIIAVSLIFVGIVMDDSDLKTIILYLSVSTSFLSLLTIFLSTLFNKEHAWVESKNRKTKTDIRQIQLTISQVNEYKNSGNKEYKFTEVYFVSPSGFIENALKLAEDNNIKCYCKQDGKFIEAKFWDHY